MPAQWSRTDSGWRLDADPSETFTLLHVQPVCVGNGFALFYVAFQNAEVHSPAKRCCSIMVAFRRPARVIESNPGLPAFLFQSKTHSRSEPIGLGFRHSPLQGGIDLTYGNISLPVALRTEEEFVRRPKCVFQCSRPRTAGPVEVSVHHSLRPAGEVSASNTS